PRTGSSAGEALSWGWRMEQRSKGLAYGGGALVMVAGLALVFGGGADTGASASAAPRTGVATDTVRAELSADLATDIAPPGLDATRPTDCLIEPSSVVRVNSGVEGVIQAVYVDRGDIVRRGQVVAQLRADVDQA